MFCLCWQVMEQEISQNRERVRSAYFKVDPRSRTVTPTKAFLERLLQGLGESFCF